MPRYHIQNVSALRIDRAFQENLLSDDYRNPEYYSPDASQPALSGNPATYQIEGPAHRQFAYRIQGGRKMSYIPSEMHLLPAVANLNIFEHHPVYLKLLPH